MLNFYKTLNIEFDTTNKCYYACQVSFKLVKYFLR